MLFRQKLNARWYPLLSLLVICYLFLPVVSYARQIESRNAANASIVAYVKQITSQTPDNSVWLSSDWNDLIIVYGQHSALNYRRMLTAVPETGQFDRERYESCLVQSVAHLLAADIPVYFKLESAWDTSKIMDAHFVLTAVPFAEDIFEVSRPAESSRRNVLATCKPVNLFSSN